MILKSQAQVLRDWIKHWKQHNPDTVRELFERYASVQAEKVQKLASSSAKYPINEEARDTENLIDPETIWEEES